MLHLYYKSIVLDEYYPNATIDTYKGVSGYIYTVDDNGTLKPQSDIPFAFTTNGNVKVLSFEYIEDAYDELIKAANNGEIILNSYENNSKQKLEWIQNIITSEYEKYKDKIDYAAFLLDKFEFLSNK